MQDGVKTGKDAWRVMAELMTSLGEVPLYDLDGYADRLMSGLMELTGAQCGMTIFAVAEPSALISRSQRSHALVGPAWRPYMPVYYNTSDEVIAASREYAASGRATRDSGSLRVTQDAGSHRAYVVSDDPETHPLEHEMLAVRGATDRLIGVHSLRDGIEVYFLFDRLEAPTHFSPEERSMLLVVLPMLRPFVYRSALSLGLIVEEGMEALTPRERETMLLLLRAQNEKEMAVTMGLTHRSMHQYVTRVYRKLNVGSRAELTELWLRGGVSSL